MPISSLADLKPGERAVIRAIQAEEALHQRLAALGFRVGKPIKMIRQASFSGPMHVRIGSTDIALRQTEARRIHLAQPEQP